MHLWYKSFYGAASVSLDSLASSNKLSSIFRIASILSFGHDILNMPEFCYILDSFLPTDEILNSNF